MHKVTALYILSSITDQLLQKINIDFMLEFINNNKYTITVRCENRLSKMVVLIPLYKSNERTMAETF